MCTARCYCCIGCKGCATCDIQYTAGMTTEATTVDGYIIVKLRSILQIIGTGCSANVVNNNCIIDGVGTISIWHNTYQIFLHCNIRKVATSIICDVSNSISIPIQFCFVVQALAWLTTRSVAYHFTSCVDIISTVS